MLHTNKKIQINEIIEYLLLNEAYFINILDLFNNNYTKLPENVIFIPFKKKGKIISMLVYTKSGFYYAVLQPEYITQVSDIIIKNRNIFCLYSNSNIVEKILNINNFKIKSLKKYYVMKLLKNNFEYKSSNITNFHCLKCNENDFKKLKKLQYLYHKEEVYDKSSYYPYTAEMNLFKEALNKRIIFAVFKNHDNYDAVSKANINSESIQTYQLGGVFTKKEYRKKGLSIFCLSNMFDHIFKDTDKTNIQLFVKKDNTAAVNLYLKLGFEIIQETILCYF